VNNNNEPSNPLIGTWEDSIGEKFCTFTSDTKVIDHQGNNYDGTPRDFPCTYTFDGVWIVAVRDGSEALYRYHIIFYDKDRKRLYSLAFFDNPEPPENFDPDNLSYYYTKRN
jgi:hypothetical protein